MEISKNKDLLYKIDSLEMQKYADYITDEDKEAFSAMCDDPLAFKEKVDKNTSFRFDITGKDKEFRGNFHHGIKKYMMGFSSATKEIDDKKYIIVQYDGKESKGKFLKFCMRKRNWDTMSAVNQLAKGIKRKTGNFFFAGNKDKRGETVQWVTAKNVLKRELAGFINMKFWKWGEISFSNLSYVNEAVKLGDLIGNRFTLALRLLEETEEKDIEHNINSLRVNGFVNYFGLQRFGTKNKVG